METIRERIQYKDNRVDICFKNLNRRQQYECIRLLLANRTQNVYICKHDSTNEYINKLLSELKISTFSCAE